MIDIDDLERAVEFLRDSSELSAMHVVDTLQQTRQVAEIPGSVKQRDSSVEMLMLYAWSHMRLPARLQRVFSSSFAGRYIFSNSVLRLRLRRASCALTSVFTHSRTNGRITSSIIAFMFPMNSFSVMSPDSNFWDRLSRGSWSSVATV